MKWKINTTTIVYSQNWFSQKAKSLKKKKKGSEGNKKRYPKMEIEQCKWISIKKGETMRRKEKSRNDETNSEADVQISNHCSE